MNRGNNLRWGVLIAGNALAWCVLSFLQASPAASTEGANEPFANSVQQRIDTIAQLKEISARLKEQNDLLRSGEVKVMIVEPKKR